MGCAADWPGTEESSKLLGEGVRTSAESECTLEFMDLRRALGYMLMVILWVVYGFGRELGFGGREWFADGSEYGRCWR